MAKGVLKIRIVGDDSHLQKTLGKATGGLAKFAKIGVLGAAAAVAGGVAISIKSFADFDAAMTESTAIMGDVSDAMRKDMSNAARDVAKTTKFSATEAAQSYFFLASAGMDAAQSIEALPKVAAFAQAGAFDMATATDLLTDAQSALGLSVDDTAQNMENMARVSDVLVKANTAANATVQEFSEALTEKAGNALRNLNKDVEEGVAVLSVYADAGVKGSAAGVQLNAVLDKLTLTADKNAEAYAELGVQVFDSSGEMHNMADIISDMETAFAGMTTEQRLAALSTLGLTRQARDGTLALLGNSEAIREYEAGLRDAAGFTDDVANKQMETFWAKLGLVKDQFLDVALSVGEALMPALEGFADWLMGKTPAITGWVQSISDKFTGLLGTTEETTDGAIVAMDSFTNMARTRSGEVVSSLGDLEGALDSFEQHTRRQLEAAGGTITTYREDAEEEFDAAGEFMAKLSEAWKTTWDEDIKPFLMDTVIPWITDEFLPAAGDAMWEAGKTAGISFLRGLWGEVKSEFTDFDWRRELGNIPDILQSPSRSAFPSPSGGGGSARPFVPMAEGAIVKRRRGGVHAQIGEGRHDEAVVPLSPEGMAQAGFGGGTTINHNYHIAGSVWSERELTEMVTRNQRHEALVNGR